MRPVWIATRASVSAAPEVLGADDARDRFAAARARARRHLLAVRRIAADRRVDAPPGLHHAPDQRDVFLLDLAVVKLPRQLLVRRVVLGDHHQPGRAAVEAMHDAGPLLAADAAEVVDVVEQRVDQRAAGVAGRRMHDHAGRLVDDDQVVVLIEDRRAAALRAAAPASTGSGISTRSPRPALTGWFALACAPGDLDLAVLDQPLNLRARLVRQHARRGSDRGGRRRCRR